MTERYTRYQFAKDVYSGLPHYSDKGGHKERSIVNKIIRKTGIPKAELVFERGKK
jgi:hypothetical protein